MARFRKKVADEDALSACEELHPAPEEGEGAIVALESKDDSVAEENGQSRTVTIEAVPSDEGEFEKLTDEEEKLLAALERQVEDSFYQAAKALREINEKKLYRATHRTFEEYCQNRFGFQRRQPYHLIDAANVMDNLHRSARSVHILPTGEYQIRPLSRVKVPEKQVEVWQRSVEKAGGKVPTHKIVKETVKEVIGDETEKGKAVEPTVSIGEVCVIKRSSHELLSDRAGFWALVTNVSSEGLTLEIYDRTVEDISSRNVTRLEYKARERESRKKLLSQMKSIHQSGVMTEEVAEVNLKFFGKLKRPTLTPLERNLLNFLERQTRKETTSSKEDEDREEQKEKGE